MGERAHARADNQRTPTGAASRPTPSMIWRAPPASQIGTASKALNGDGRLRQGNPRQDRARRPRDRAYRPNDLAQSLRRARSQPSASSRTTASAASPFRSSRRWRSGWLTRASPSSCATPPTIPPASAQHLDQLLRKRVDGLVVTARRADRRPPIGLRPRHSRRLRVHPGRRCPVPSACCRTTKAGGARHRAPGRARPPPHRPYHRARALRGGAPPSRGLSPLAAAGLSELPGFYLPGVWSEAWGREASPASSTRHAPPDALFCGNDQIARGAADALRERGIAVPDDVAIAASTTGIMARRRARR